MALAKILIAFTLCAPGYAATKSIWKKETVDTKPFKAGDRSKNRFALAAKTALAPAPTSNSTTFCSELADYLPSFCSCVDSSFGGTLDCTVAIVAAGVTLDTVGVILDMQPCAEPMYYSMEVTEADLGVDYKFEIAADEEEEIPIPDVSVDIPGLGEAGLFADVSVFGNIDALEIHIGLDACADVLGYETCASTVDPVDFPIWILDETFDFSTVCASR
mmetsp:Transcript_89047/g.172493  ORF Transcript_89047/g.172493 Transcript_89047/m.172493 type:complete len:218 (-) Transcript_89047:193-846(-)